MRIVTERSEEGVTGVYYRTSDHFHDEGVRIYTELVYKDGSKSGWLYHESTPNGFRDALVIAQKIQRELFDRLVLEPHFLIEQQRRLINE